MALQHAIPGEPFDVRPFGVAVGNTRSTALFKSRDLEVLRLVLLAGKTLPPHKVDGEITIHCLEGSLEVDVGGRARTLYAGHLMVLEGGVVHAVRALADASALVTIALKPVTRAAASGAGGASGAG